MGTKGRITGIKRTTETIKTVAGTTATHIEASNEDELTIFGHVRSENADANIVAEVGIKTGGKVVATLTLDQWGNVSLFDPRGVVVLS